MRTLTQRAGQPGRNPGTARVPAFHPDARSRPGTRNVSKLIYARGPAEAPVWVPPRCTRGSKNFLGIFPHPRCQSLSANSTHCRRGQKHGMFQARNINCADAIFSDVKIRFLAVSPPIRYRVIPPVVCVARFFLQQCIHRTAPLNAIRSGYTTTRKGLRQTRAAFITDGESCTQPIAECAFAPNAVLDG